MPSAPASLQTLRKFVKQHPAFHEIVAIMVEISKDPNDRATALTAGSLLESALREALLPKLIVPEKEGEDDLFGSQAPLRSFSAKIRMGFAVGLYGPQTRADLDMIREVRNAFAHGTQPLGYETDQIATVCTRIKLAERCKIGLGVNPNDPRLRYLLPTCWLTLMFDAMGKVPTNLEPRKDGDPEALAMFHGLKAAIAE